MKAAETAVEAMGRQGWLGLLAAVPGAWIDDLWHEVGTLPAHDILRAPEIGSVMLRGRAGGTGAPFNLGEMTVTRASARLADGRIGHAVVQGRDKAKALRVALLDALLQDDDGTLRARVLGPLVRRRARRAAERAAKAAATQVEFFTLVRGED